MSVVGTVVWLVTRNGVLAISAAIAADFLAGVPTVMKSWTHPETETVLLLHRGRHQHGHPAADRSTHWTFEVAAFPIFIVVHGARSRSSWSVWEPGPRLRRARHHDRTAGRAPPRRSAGPSRRCAPGRKTDDQPKGAVRAQRPRQRDRHRVPSPRGIPRDPPLLLVMGLGAQLITWPQGFVDGLARAAGFFVDPLRQPRLWPLDQVRGHARPRGSLFAGDPSSAPYRIEDMADDAAALLTSSASRGPTSSVPRWAA